MLYRFKKLNAYPMLCMNGCRIDNLKYNDSYVNIIFKDGFLKRMRRRTRDAMLSVEGDPNVLKIFLTEVIPREDDEPPRYRTRQLTIDDFTKRVNRYDVEISEEYHSANRIILRGEILRPAKRLELNHHRQYFELQFRTKNDTIMFYYYND